MSICEVSRLPIKAPAVTLIVMYMEINIKDQKAYVWVDDMWLFIQG